MVAGLLPTGLGGEGEGDLGAVGLAQDGLGLVGPGHTFLILGEVDANLPEDSNKINLIHFSKYIK